MAEEKTAQQLEQEFIEFASARDVSISSPVLDGSFKRIDGLKKNSGWYIGSHLRSSKGFAFLCATFGDWVSGEQYTFVPNLKLSHRDKAEIKHLQAKAKKANDEAKLIARKKAAEKASSMADSLPVATHHPYLTKKQIKAFGIQQFKDSLFIPTRTVRGMITGAQYIKPDGEKFFMTGQQITACMFVIGTPKGATQAYLVEGVATGATVAMATEMPVFCAFNANNLEEVAKEIRHAYPKLELIVCGDDDHATEGNPGKTKALKASRVFKNRPLFPVFEKYEGKNTTDFNDLHVREGLSAVREILTLKLDKGTYDALGINGPYFYFYSHRTNTIIRLRSFGPDNIQQLMTLDTLESQFGNDNGGVNWDQARDMVITESMNQGIFSPQRIRGVGAWKDGDSTIVNTGKHLIVDGRVRPMSDIDSVYTYTASQFQFRKPEKPLTTQECQKLLNAIRLFNWEHFDSIALLGGWLAIARIAGALPIRPHLWITSGEGAGKSTLFDLILTGVLGGSEGYLAAQGQSTAAGIRQTLKGDSLPVIYDEFETEANNGIQRGVLELIRQAWSRTNARIYKGSADGSAMDFDPQFCSLVSSIKVHLENAQDKGRFSVLELARHNGSTQHAERMAEAAAQITEDFGHRLFARSIDKVDNIIEGHKVFKAVITGMGHTSRLGDQVGMLLAGYFSLISDQPPGKKEAEELCLKLKQLTDASMVDTRRDEELCLQHLLTNSVRYTIGDDEKSVTHEATIAAMIDGSPEVQSKLNLFGLKVVKGQYLAVCSSHEGLRRIFQNTHWKEWNHSLSRLPGALKRKTVRIDRTNIAGIYIPLTVVQPPENVIELPKVSMPTYRTSKELTFVDGKYPSGTAVEIVRNIFSCKEMTQDEKIGLSKQLKKDPSLCIVKLAGKFRTLSQDFVESVS